MLEEVYDRLSKIGIVPVVRIDDEEDALPLAKALMDGGIDTAEITFRSAHAPYAISEIAKNYPDMIVGAGTVLTIEQAKLAKDSGAKFIVTPGLNVEIVKWCIDNDVPVIPGISTASEVETALSLGINHVKFFPAESSGGAKKIKDLSAPYQQVKFLPTGGINANNMHDYLSLPCVDAIGGSFMLPQDAIANKDWDQIRELTKKAIASLLNYELAHIGMYHEDDIQAKKSAELLCKLFNFTDYSKPKSIFAGKGFELLFDYGKGEKGHIAFSTPYPDKAIYHLGKLGIDIQEDTITRNTKTNRINFVYLDLEISGFAIHLVNPDGKMD